MGIVVLCLGASGSGKSASLRNFDSKEVGVFNVASKPLPFKSDIPKIDGANYETITTSLKNNTLDTYVIDDSQYLMVFEEFDKMRIGGYGKFTEMAFNFYELIKCAIEKTSQNTIVYFLHHTDVDEAGRIKAKTVGKMIDNHLTLEGLFSVVLLAGTNGTEYWFETQSDGLTTAKSPIGLFDDKKIPNDLKYVDERIRDYWGLQKGEKNGPAVES